jgi:AraC-like DNA-binding protein
MSTIEAALRGGAVALLALLALAGMRDRWRTPAARYGALLATSVAAYAIQSAPEAKLQHAAWVIPLRLISIGAPALFWLWAAACFDDEFRPSWDKFLPWVALVVLGASCIFGGWPAAWIAMHALSLLLAGLAVWQVLAGRAGDLVEARRRLRVILTIGTGLYITTVTVTVTVTEPMPQHRVGGISGTMLNAAGLTLMALAFALTRLFEDHGDTPLVRPAESGLAPIRLPEPTQVDLQEQALLDALRRMMEEDKIYLEEGFSIAALAARLGTAEYRLRRLINRRLGHRNFSSFVNGYRLAEAKAALADPSQAEVPILTIALDAGFQSIGPFNRTFKAETGMTPSEFRRTRLAASPYGAAAN